jgi:hypothetical protein
MDAIVEKKMQHEPVDPTESASPRFQPLFLELPLPALFEAPACDAQSEDPEDNERVIIIDI